MKHTHLTQALREIPSKCCGKPHAIVVTASGGLTDEPHHVAFHCPEPCGKKSFTVKAPRKDLHDGAAAKLVAHVKAGKHAPGGDLEIDAGGRLKTTL